MKILSFSIATLTLIIAMSLTGCESETEKSERLRLEKIYAMDNQEIANAFSRSFSEPYKAVRSECEKEKIEKNPGRWCKKWGEVKAAYKPNFDFSRPKF